MQFLLRGYAVVEKPKDTPPIPSGLGIKPSSEPIEVAAEHVPQLVLQRLGLGQGSQASQALMQGRLAALMAIR